jgi:cytochrome oxidase Cu insertion factor (SCO1/SenC/PrrC family)
LFERAAQFDDVMNAPYNESVAEKAKAELYEVRHLSIGKTAPDIEGQDQEGQPFRLSDYRGKVVLLYFWMEY